MSSALARWTGSEYSAAALAGEAAHHYLNLRSAMEAVMRFRTLPLVASLLLAGCVSQGTVERGQLNELAVGRTTSAEIEGSWGPPLLDAAMPDGRHVLTYRYLHLQTGPVASFVPGFGPIGSTTDTVTGRVMLTFDPKGVLLSYTMEGAG